MNKVHFLQIKYSIKYNYYSIKYRIKQILFNKLNKFKLINTVLNTVKYSIYSKYSSFTTKLNTVLNTIIAVLNTIITIIKKFVDVHFLQNYHRKTPCHQFFFNFFYHQFSYHFRGGKFDIRYLQFKIHAPQRTLSTTMSRWIQISSTQLTNFAHRSRIPSFWNFNRSLRRIVGIPRIFQPCN